MFYHASYLHFTYTCSCYIQYMLLLIDRNKKNFSMRHLLLPTDQFLIDETIVTMKWLWLNCEILTRNLKGILLCIWKKNERWSFSLFNEWILASSRQLSHFAEGRLTEEGLYHPSEISIKSISKTIWKKVGCFCYTFFHNIYIYVQNRRVTFVLMLSLI